MKTTIMKISKLKISNTILFRTWLFICLFISLNVFAQTDSVNQTLNNAATTISGYFDAASKLVYAISAIIGLIGAIKVYSKWNSGDPDTQKVAAAWFGACIFLVVVATVIKTFFSINVSGGGDADAAAKLRSGSTTTTVTNP